LIYQLNGTTQPAPTCGLLILEHLSSSFYVDKYQVEDIERYHTKHNTSHFFIRFLKDIDLEKPEFHSTSNDIFIFVPNPYPAVQAVLPFHIRYHKPSEQNLYITANITAPSFFLFCKNDETPSTTNQTNMLTYSWRRACVKLKDANDTLSVQIPVGQLKMEYQVTFFTLLATLICVLLVTYFTITAQN
jgi:hypothetical protein